MNDSWNDELRRAYDRGYWDARREMQRQSERQDDGDRTNGRTNERRQQMDGGNTHSDERNRRRYRDDEGSYQPNWREREGGYERGWDRRESSPGLRSSDYDTSGFGSAEDRWTGRTVNDAVDTSRRARDRHRGEDERHDNQHEQRGFFERAGDEIRSWFDDDDNDRRRRR